MSVDPRTRPQIMRVLHGDTQPSEPDYEQFVVGADDLRSGDTVLKDVGALVEARTYQQATHAIVQPRPACGAEGRWGERCTLPPGHKPYQGVFAQFDHCDERGKSTRDWGTESRSPRAWGTDCRRPVRPELARGVGVRVTYGGVFYGYALAEAEDDLVVVVGPDGNRATYLLKDVQTVPDSEMPPYRPPEGIESTDAEGRSLPPEIAQRVRIPDAEGDYMAVDLYATELSAEGWRILERFASVCALTAERGDA